MDDLYLKILKEGYSLKFYGGKRTRTGFVCQTDKGLKEIRKGGNDLLRLKAECDLRHYMKDRGFKISEFEICDNGDFFYEINGNKYVLEDCMEGEELDFSNFCQAMRGAEILGHFHNCSEGFESDDMPNDMDRIHDIFVKRYTELKRIRKRIKEKRRYSGIDMIVIENFDIVSDMAEKSINIIENFEESILNNKKYSLNTVCHNAFKGDNVKILKNGCTTVTNLDKCSKNFTVWDLADFIRRLIKTEVFDENQLLEIINSYKNVRNIDDNDMNILKAFLMFPQKFLSICNEYYNKRSVCISDAMMERFSKSAMLIKKNSGFSEIL